MKKLLVTGGTGMVASKFLELYGSEFEVESPTIEKLDITSRPQVKKYLHNNEFDAVVNFAAYTDVGNAENERGNKNGLCWKINVEGTKNLLDFSKLHNLHFVQISTDMVFPGTANHPGPYSEDSEVETESENVTWYGWTKSRAEDIVKRYDNSSIIRIMYAVSAKYDVKEDYLRFPLRLYREGKLYPLFTDQVVSVSLVDEVSKAVRKVVTSEQKGIYHATSSNTGSPYEIISYLVEKVEGNAVIEKSSIDDFLKKADNPVRYPKHSGLSVKYTEKKLGLDFLTWEKVVDELVSQGIGD